MGRHEAYCLSVNRVYRRIVIILLYKGPLGRKANLAESSYVTSLLCPRGTKTGQPLSTEQNSANGTEQQIETAAESPRAVERTPHALLNVLEKPCTSSYSISYILPTVQT